MSLSYSLHAQKIISALDLKHKSGSEYGDRPCPNCGGTDRFWIAEHNGELMHHCRQNCDFVKRYKVLQDRGLLPKWESNEVPYHIRKCIPLIGAYLDNDRVIIPLKNVESGEKTGTQEIFPNGRKKFTKGMTKQNSGAFIGDRTDILYVCEGWADAVAIHLSTGQQTFFALDAKTLSKTVQKLVHPQIVITADNDAEGKAAAEATGKPYVLPDIENGDWWDVYNQGGSKAVLEGLRAIQGLPEDLLSGLSISSALE